MKNDDYGFYGKGLDGYVHYRQGMQEAVRSRLMAEIRPPVMVFANCTPPGEPIA